MIVIIRTIYCIYFFKFILFRVSRGFCAALTAGLRPSYPAEVSTSKGPFVPGSKHAEAASLWIPDESKDNMTLPLSDEGFHCVGMVSGPAMLPYADLVGLVPPNKFGRAPHAMGALRPAVCLLVVSLPNNHKLLYLEASPLEFCNYSSCWPALYMLAMQLVHGSFQPGS